MNAIKEKHSKGWLESQLSSLQKYKSDRSCFILAHFSDHSISPLSIPLIHKDQRSVYIYWTEMDTLQKACAERLKQEYNVVHLFLSDDIIRRLLESNKTSVIVITSNKYLSQQFINTKSVHHVVVRSQRVDNTALDGYSRRLCVDISSILRDMTHSSVSHKISDTTLKFAVGSCTFVNRNQVIDNVLNIVNTLWGKNLIGITFQCTKSAYLAVK